MMKSRDFNDAQNIINGVKVGNVTRRDLTALLIYVREHLPNDMIKDIAHCVAHSDRDRGYAYSHIKTFASNFISVARSDGVITVAPIFPRDAFASKLSQDLVSIGFTVTQADIEQNIEVIEAYLTDILADTVILLNNSDIKSCRFEEGRVDGKSTLAFVVYLQGLRPGTLDVPDGVGVACPVFSEEVEGLQAANEGSSIRRASRERRHCTLWLHPPNG